MAYRINFQNLRKLGLDEPTIAAFRRILEIVGSTDDATLVSSVNGKSGTVSLTTAHIPEGSNLYYTDYRVRAALNVAGNGLSYSVITGVTSSNATDANTPETLVFRDALGNFSANTITAALDGNAATATYATGAGSASTADYATEAGAVPFGGVTGTPTTLAGYGITDAALDSAVVHKTGAETVAGVKTFTSAPTVSKNTGALPAPSGDTILHAANANANNTRLLLDCFGAVPLTAYRTASGTAAVPAALTVNMPLGAQAYSGYGATAYSGTRASFNALAAEGWTDTAQGTYVTVTTTKAGGTSNREVLRITDAGDVSAKVVGAGFRVAEGSNAKQGTATLAAGTVTVSNTSVTANSRIQLTSQADGGTPGWLRVSDRVAGTSFTITSSSATDTSTVAYFITEPA